MEIAANSDNQPLNKPKGHKKPLANPFGTINQSFNDSNDFEPLTSPDQPFQNTTYSSRNANSLKTPFPQNSYNNDAEEELEGSISLGAGDNTVTTTSVKPAKSSTQSTNKDSYSVNFSNDFTGFEPGPTQRNTGGSSASGGSVLGSLMGFASLLTSGQPQTGGQAAAEYDEENEPPLLEDLGIDLTLIKMRALSVLKFQKCSQEFVAEADMTGPLILFLVLGMLLLLQGKMHFGYLYGFGTLGTLGVYLMMNLLSQETKVHLYNTMSILGYCLFPIVALAFFHVFISLQNFFGLLLSLGAIGWATFAATNFFQVLLSLSEQKWLIAYPIFLFYMVFVLITIF